MTSPDLYNIALDCVDKHAHSLHNKHKTALVFVQGSPSPPPSPSRGEGDRVIKLTFSNLEGLTNRFANALGDLGLKKGERLLIRLPNSPEFPVTFLGAIKAGLIPIPNSPLNTWHELEFLLEDSESSVLVTTLDLFPPELLQKRPPSLKHVLLLTPKEAARPSGTHRWEDLLKGASPNFNTELTNANDPAFWLYTSGTEGRPKAVIHAHRSIPAHDERARLWQDLRPNDVIFNTSSLNWSYALTCGLLDVWRHGLPTLIYSGELSGEKICHLVKHFGVTTFMSVPGIYRRLVDYLVGGTHASPLKGVRACLSAGEKLSEEIREKFRRLSGLEIYEGLGMTEHSVYLAQRFGEAIVKGSCGKPLPSSPIAVLRGDFSQAAPGETGILASHKSCPGLMLNYYHRSEEDTLVFQGDWFLSGDLAYRDEEGNFFFGGRRDDVITSGGYRISPLEVEAVLNQHPLILESAAVSQEREAGKTLLIAYVVLQDQKKRGEETKIQIRSYAEEHLAKYKVPREIYFMEALPKTTNGKIKRKELEGEKR